MELCALSAIELQYQVERLLARYVQCIDDDRLESWPNFFVDDCTYRIISRENAERLLPVAAIFCDSRGMLVDRVVSLRHANIYERHYYRHIVSSVLINALTDNVVHARSHYVVYRTRTNGLTETYNAGTYDDEVVEVEGELLFRSKIVTFDTHRIDSLLVIPI